MTPSEHDLDAILAICGLQEGATLQDTQRRLRVDSASALRLHSLKDAIAALRAVGAGAFGPDAMNASPTHWMPLPSADPQEARVGASAAVQTEPMTREDLHEAIDVHPDDEWWLQHVRIVEPSQKKRAATKPRKRSER